MRYPKEWNILPLPSNRKYPPLLKNWDTTRFPREKLKEYEGNFALGTGDISGGLIVFDWDFRKGKKKVGFNVIFKEYKQQFPTLSNTLIAETPHGYHFYYKCKGDQYKNTKSENIGYSKSLKVFIDHNDTRFAEYLKGLDTRANGGYVVMPPSEIGKKKYTWYQEQDVKEITSSQYQQIFQFFKETDTLNHTVRSKFVELLMGEIDIHDITRETGKDEHVYWKEVYHEVYTSAKLDPHYLYKGLEKYQPSFDLDKTKIQIANKENIEYIKNGKRLTREKYAEYFQTELFEFEEKYTRFEYDNKEIQIYNDHTDLITFYKERPPKIEKILSSDFTITRKCYYKKEERFTYILNGKHFYMDTILEIIRKAEPYLRKGIKGKDCLKEVIEFLGTKVKTTRAKDFLGFDNGWNLPQTEDDKNISIITITDYQQEAYERTFNIIRNYTEKEKEKIEEKLKTFIERTQAELINVAILISWSIAAPFRLFFINEFDLFPILYNFGEPDTGRSSLEDFWIVDFYKIYKDHLPPSTSMAQLEDHLSESTFPHSYQDVKKTSIDPKLIPMLQDYSTNIGKFERKKSAREVDFIKYKVSSLNLDSNDIIDVFTNPAINERQVFCLYKQKTKSDLKWISLRRELKKERLFSFIFDYTRDWTDTELLKRFIPILNRFTKFKTNSTRLQKSGAIIRFGMELFESIFNITFEITDKDIIDAIIEGSSKMTSEIVDQFRNFCQSAIAYEEIEANNPKYLNHKLRLSCNEKYYAYTSDNHIDFQRRMNMRIGMKALVDKLHKGMSLDDAEYIEYTLARPFRVGKANNKCKPMGILKISPLFFVENGHAEVELDASCLSLNEIQINDFPEYNEKLYNHLITLLEKDPQNECYMDNIRAYLLKEGFDERVIGINLDTFVEKNLFVRKKDSGNNPYLTFGELI